MEHAVLGTADAVGCKSTCHEIQERQALKVLGLLVAELHNLVVALSQSLDTQPVPGVLVVKLLHYKQEHCSPANT